MNSRGLLYCHCYYYYACIFLLLGLLSREGLSKPQSDIERCQEETDELYSNSFRVAQQVSNIDAWTELQRSTTATAATNDDDGAKLNSVCSIQSEKKTTCVLDYANATDSSAWCLDVPDTLYVETSFVFKCSASKGRTLFYTVRDRPACYAFTETSLCYNVYDNDVIESIERELFNELTSELTSPSTTNSDHNEWGDTGAWETCEQIRFVVSDPILSEAVVIVAETPVTNPDGNTDSDIDGDGFCAGATALIQSSPLIADAVRTLEEQVVGNIANSSSESSLSLSLESSSLIEDIDYGDISHNISSICLEEMNGIYLELSYTVSCNFTTAEANVNAETDDAAAMSFRVLSDPLCLSKMVCGKNDFENQSIAHASSKWTTSFSEHIRQIIRSSNSSGNSTSTPDDNIVVSGVQIQGLVQWEDFSPSSSPTTTSAPTLTSAPSLNPTATLKPTTSSAPTESPTALSCKDESLNLISWQQQSKDGGDDNENENKIAEGLTKIEDLMMMMDDDNGNGFMKHCNTMSTSATTSDSNSTTQCEFNYDDIIISNNTNATGNETETAENNSIAALCRNANAVYVENSVSITCTSVSSSSAVTRLVVRNKPSCRSKKCNADGVREVAVIEFERWIRMTLEKGIVNVATESSSGEEDDDDEGKMSIMTGPQSCVIDTDEGGFLVAVGGSSISTNNNDGDIGGPIEPTDECRAETDQVDGLIEIYNHNIITQREFLDYIDTDFRQICGSPKPNILACNFDWNELFSKTGADLKSNCLAEEDENNGSSGQYVESSFQVSCVNAEGELTMTNTNVPGCIGKPCSPTQSLYLLKDHYTFLTNRLIEEGWSCTTEVLSVYAPHFDPFYISTYDADTDGNQNLQFEDADGNPIDDIEDRNGNSDESGNVNSNSNNNIIDVEKESPATQPENTFPTPAPMGGGGLSGPKFGSIYGAVPTEAPSGNTEVDMPSANTEVDMDYSQSSSAATGTVTSRIITILLLPIALVMVGQDLL